MEMIYIGNRLLRFHFRVKAAPQAAARYQRLITNIINGEKPAYVPYELGFVPKNQGEEK